MKEKSFIKNLGVCNTCKYRVILHSPKSIDEYALVMHVENMSITMVGDKVQTVINGDCYACTNKNYGTRWRKGDICTKCTGYVERED